MQVAENGDVYRSKVIRSGVHCPKYAYTSRKIAKHHAAVQSKSSGDRIEAYHCVGCHCWHIGHPPRSRGAKQRRQRRDTRLAA